MRENYNESKQLSNIQSYQNDLVVKNFKNKELIQSSENSSINTLATNSSQHLSTSKKENLNISTETSSLTNSHSTLNPGENGKTPSFVSNHSSKMTEITENECSSITQKAFVNNSVGSSENSLNSTTPTNKRSLNSVASDNNKPANTNNSNTMFELNDKHPSITLSCHSSETSSVNDSRSSIPKNSKKDQKNNEKNDKADENENNESTGNKKFGFKHLRKTISKTFSKASFRTFSISHKKTANGTVTGASMEPAQDLGFTSKDEEEEFNNFVNTLNMKKNKQRPSLSMYKPFYYYIILIKMKIILFNSYI